MPHAPQWFWSEVRSTQVLPHSVPPEHPLLTCEQVVLTPHVADQNAEGVEILHREAVDNVIAFLAGCPRNRVT